ncbi:terminase small subunit [Novosphingobium sp. ST904]|uniref:terminase small subunit n=1 Tax=Novosphingobium sp. ST904 TaxID=1684385 RepID=UPI0006C8E533|nr:terminase small subunit [Novosphingobium sp. ST904]KPH67549.1 terminase [Novosphingobium sp. ST904]TCM30054.1 phage terminase small subunit [Novosphingobium sp. ST904]
MLTPKQQRFVEEYLVDFKGGPAYTRAGYTATGNSAEAAASRLLRNAKVQAAIAAAQRALSERTEITQDMVLERWWQIATADPNDLVQFRRTCCRYCYGQGHAYQWIDAEEFAAAVRATMAAAGSDEPRALPKDDGGFGYDNKADPHSECPQCFGEGNAEIHAKDTRKLKGAARLLYAGAKLTQAGFEIKMMDQGKALENVARHLGMFKDKLELEVTENLADVLAAARGRVLGNGE